MCDFVYQLSIEGIVSSSFNSRVLEVMSHYNVAVIRTEDVQGAYYKMYNHDTTSLLPSTARRICERLLHGAEVVWDFSIVDGESLNADWTVEDEEEQPAPTMAELRANLERAKQQCRDMGVNVDAILKQLEREREGRA